MLNEKEAEIVSLKRGMAVGKDSDSLIAENSEQRVGICVMSDNE